MTTAPPPRKTGSKVPILLAVTLTTWSVNALSGESTPPSHCSSRLSARTRTHTHSISHTTTSLTTASPVTHAHLISRGAMVGRAGKPFGSSPVFTYLCVAVLAVGVGSWAVGNRRRFWRWKRRTLPVAPNVPQEIAATRVGLLLWHPPLAISRPPRDSDRRVGDICILEGERAGRRANVSSRQRGGGSRGERGRRDTWVIATATYSIGSCSSAFRPHLSSIWLVCVCGPVHACVCVGGRRGRSALECHKANGTS